MPRMRIGIRLVCLLWLLCVFFCIVFSRFRVHSCTFFYIKTRIRMLCAVHVRLHYTPVHSMYLVF